MGKQRSKFKIVQSFWSKPLIEHRDFIDVTKKTHKKSGGWLIDKSYFMSCALSCLKLNEFYENIELVTDNYGKEILIDTLKLPYSNVRLDLEEINHLHKDLWAIGKLIAYKIQTEPFLHVDNDIFIWKSFEENLLNSGIVVQHAEDEFEFYKKLCIEIYENFTGFTNELGEYTKNGGTINNISSYNFGIFGGRNIEFIKFYVDFVFDFLYKNSDNIEKINTGVLSVYLEQSIFHQLSNQYKIGVSKLSEDTDIIDNIYHFCHFENIPTTSYIHTIGYSKRNPIINEQVHMNLLNEYPEYYKKIDNIFNP